MIKKKNYKDIINDQKDWSWDFSKEFKKKKKKKKKQPDFIFSLDFLETVFNPYFKDKKLLEEVLYANNRDYYNYNTKWFWKIKTIYNTKELVVREHPFFFDFSKHSCKFKIKNQRENLGSMRFKPLSHLKKLELFEYFYYRILKNMYFYINPLENYKNKIHYMLMDNKYNNRIFRRFLLLIRKNKKKTLIKYHFKNILKKFVLKKSVGPIKHYFKILVNYQYELKKLLNNLKKKKKNFKINSLFINFSFYKSFIFYLNFQKEFKRIIKNDFFFKLYYIEPNLIINEEFKSVKTKIRKTSHKLIKEYQLQKGKDTKIISYLFKEIKDDLSYIKDPYEELNYFPYSLKYIKYRFVNYKSIFKNRNKRFNKKRRFNKKNNKRFNNKNNKKFNNKNNNRFDNKNNNRFDNKNNKKFNNRFDNKNNKKFNNRFDNKNNKKFDNRFDNKNNDKFNNIKKFNKNKRFNVNDNRFNNKKNFNKNKLINYNNYQNNEKLGQFNTYDKSKLKKNNNKKKKKNILETLFNIKNNKKKLNKGEIKKILKKINNNDKFKKKFIKKLPLKLTIIRKRFYHDNYKLYRRYEMLFYKRRVIKRNDLFFNSLRFKYYTLYYNKNKINFKTRVLKLMNKERKKYSNINNLFIFLTRHHKIYNQFFNNRKNRRLYKLKYNALTYYSKPFNKEFDNRINLLHDQLIKRNFKKSIDYGTININKNFLSKSFKKNQYKNIITYSNMFNKILYRKAICYIYGNSKYNLFKKFYKKSYYNRYKNKVIKFFEFYERLLFIVLLRMNLVFNYKQAIYLIKNGYVLVNNKVIKHVNYNVKNESLIRIKREGYLTLFNFLFIRNKNKKLNQEKYNENLSFYFSKIDKIKNKRVTYFKLYKEVPNHLLVNFRILSGIFLHEPIILKNMLKGNNSKYNHLNKRLNILLENFIESFSFFRINKF